MRPYRWLMVFGAMTIASLVSRPVFAQVGPSAKEVDAVLAKGIAYLKTTQNKDGSFAPKLGGPGVTAIVVAALAKNGVSPQDPVMAKALEYLQSQVKDDGGVYSKGLANYTTSVAIMAFKDVNKDGKYTSVIDNAKKFLLKIQQDPDEKSPFFGGFGYDSKSRPDLSNTAFTVEALLASGLPKDDPAIQKALKFISRCQNLPGETNELPFAKKTTEDDKGGFTYVLSDKEKAEGGYATKDGGLRSLGGMTYNGLKTFLFAGVGKDDQRVKAAILWIRNHWTLDENPGMGNAGLYYYYHTFGKAMTAWGEDQFEDAKGKKHDWRMELFQALAKKQAANGSWTNTGDKTFGESNSDLATAFALLSLSYTQPAVAAKK
jgi:hypothetical protein